MADFSTSSAWWLVSFGVVIPWLGAFLYGSPAQSGVKGCVLLPPDTQGPLTWDSGIMSWLRVSEVTQGT